MMKNDDDDDTYHYKRLIMMMNTDDGGIIFWSNLLINYSFLRAMYETGFNRSCLSVIVT